MHINLEIAFDLMEGRLEQVVESQLNEHLSSCDQCSTDMQDWRAFRMSLKRQHLESAPKTMVASALALFQAPKKAEERKTIRQVLATLRFDSFVQPAFAGVRGET